MRTVLSLTTQDRNQTEWSSPVGKIEAQKVEETRLTDCVEAYSKMTD